LPVRGAAFAGQAIRHLQDFAEAIPCYRQGGGFVILVTVWAWIFGTGREKSDSGIAGTFADRQSSRNRSAVAGDAEPIGEI